ncbi:hypothetical protein EBZ80_19170 [bacterium]|nr:hypothetical protein [bacterium]
MKLQLFERSVYGRRNIYSTGDLAPYVQQLTRRTTLDHRDLDALTELGFFIEWVKDPNNQHDK